ncbi:tetratricopeptide repeat protein [Bacillus sp. PS06]|uniref:tetratricopeptide repeat protein n=1 Tax=Bacillus sp. PS06 TaxID=2764176 RepID=UPI00178553BE|nr:tetratricopeptide repeat protein [Bacillus sp. PS06]MBD8070713.1 DnaJ domain-containing protein [Bacillus sp. PS06]
MENFYELIQVDSSISQDELKEKLIEAQRKWLGRTNAPDLKRRQDAERKIELLNEAEAILLDPAKRAQYDKELEASKYQFNTEEQSTVDHTNLNADELVDEAWTLLEKGRTADAVVVGKRATEKSSSNPNAWAVLARAHYMWNEFDDAIYEYKKAIDIATNNDVFYYDLSDVYMDHPRLSDAEKINYAEQLIRKALSIKPTERAYHFRLAYLARFKGEYDHAIEILKKLIETHGKDPSLGNELALNYYNKCLMQMYYKEGYYSFISKESAETGLVLLREAKIYATDRDLLESIQTFIDLGENALKTRFLKGRFAGLAIIPVIWLLTALSTGSFINIVISGALLYGAWKISRIPVWKDNFEVHTGKRQQRNQNIAAVLQAMAKK